MKISTAKIDRWANILFPKTDWKDKDNDKRIDKDELAPSQAIISPDRPSIERDIKNTYAPLIIKLDINADGLSLDEIKTYITPPIDMGYKVDLNQVINGLKEKGEYKVPNIPILFVTEDKMPADVKNVQGAKEQIENNIGKGNPISLGISKVKNNYQKRTIIGADKFIIIVFPKSRLSDERTFLIEDSLRHELVHAKQYFYGKSDEYSSILYFMFKSQKVDVYYMKLIYDTVPFKLMEIEAYQKISLRSAIQKKDLKYIKHCCSLINAHLIFINLAKQKLLQCGLKELVSLIDEFLEEALPIKEMENLNKALKNISAEAGCQIYRDITKSQWNTIYR